MAGRRTEPTSKTSHHTAALREAFELFDKDGDGNITASELHSVMASIGQPVGEQQAVEMIRLVDKDGNGLIDFDEFCQMMKKRSKSGSGLGRQTDTSGELQSLFAAFDKDNNGYVDKSEITTTMASVGLELSEEDVRMMMEAAGVANQDRIYYEDFVKMMSGSIGSQTHCRDSGSYSSSTLASSNGDLQDLCVAFSMFDKDGDGQITVSEVAQTMTSLGLAIRLSDIQQMVDCVDTDGNGTISFDEFCELMRAYQKTEVPQGRDTKSTDAQLQETFKIFDKDHDGFLSAADLRNTMNELGLSLSRQDVHDMMKSVGVPPNGKISYSDFCKMFSSCGLLENKTSGSKEQTSIDASRQSQRRIELQAVFALFDKDGDGFVTQKEVSEVLLSMDINPSPEYIQQIFHKVDADGNDQIDFDEFCVLVTNCEKPSTEDHEIRDMFNAIDKDRNGFVDAEELKSTFIGLGVPLTDADVQDMMREANVHGDRIFYEDFVQIIMTKLGGQDTQKTKPGSKKPLKITEPTATSRSKNASRLEELHIQFAQFDKDSDGRITQQELSDVMMSLGFAVKPDEIQSMLQCADTDKNGTIDFAEFCELMKRYQQSESMQASNVDAKQVFKVFDKNSDGVIDEKELQQTMKELGVTLSDDDVTAMFYEAGCEDSRQITYKEFVNMVMSGAGSLPGLVAADVTTSVPAPVCQNQYREVCLSAPKDAATEMHQLRSLVNAEVKFNGGTKQYKRSQSAPDMWKAFKVFDRNSDGYVSKSELYHTLKELGVNLTLEELNSKMREADSNQDGRIDYAEFCNLMRGAFECFARQAALLHKQKSVTETTVEQEVVDRSKIRQTLKSAFDTVDRDYDGRINADELLQVAETSGITLKSKQHAHALIRKYGSKGDGRVDFNEFKLIQSHCEAGRERHLSERSRDAEQRMRTAFKVFDIDGNGFIDASELMSTLSELGGQISQPDAEALLKAADKNGDGQIDYEEFILMMYP